MLSSTLISQYIALGVIGVLLCEVYRLREELELTQQICKTPEEETTADTALEANIIKEKQTQQYLNKLYAEGSSVWCSGSKHTSRICRFRNLCFISKKQSFVFFHGPNSSLVGVPNDRFDPALLDLSGVENHNTQYFNFVDVPLWAAAEILSNVDIIHATSLIFKRFHPDNIMHVIHDDLLPLYTTLKMITASPVSAECFDIQLLFADLFDEGQYFDLYQLFTKSDPLLLYNASQNLPTDNSRDLCFTDVYVGLSKQTVWYQYGFYEPQGPLQHSTVTSHDILQFTWYLSRRLRTTSKDTSEVIVLLTRKETRLIVNEMELCLALTKHFQMKVVSISLETHDIQQIVEVLSHAVVVIGMHGSLLVFSIFLPPGSVIVELFPYGINPDHYTPYKTLASIPGLDLVYRSWQNRDKSRNIEYPDRTRELGGIRHLTTEQQNLIRNSEEVQPHLCCSDPAWLFRIYQDTIVNIDDILHLVNSGLDERVQILKKKSMKQAPGKLHLDSRFAKHPAEVHLQCRSSCGMKGPSLEMYWKSPWNARYIGDVTYKIWLQKVGDEYHITYTVRENELVISENIDNNAYYHVWVRAMVMGVQGPVTFTSCNTTLCDL